MNMTVSSAPIAVLGAPGNAAGAAAGSAGAGSGFAGALVQALGASGAPSGKTAAGLPANLLALLGPMNAAPASAPSVGEDPLALLNGLIRQLQQLQQQQQSGLTLSDDANQALAGLLAALQWLLAQQTGGVADDSGLAAESGPAAFPAAGTASGGASGWSAAAQLQTSLQQLAALLADKRQPVPASVAAWASQLKQTLDQVLGKPAVPTAAHATQPSIPQASVLPAQTQAPAGQAAGSGERAASAQASAQRTAAAAEAKRVTPTLRNSVWSGPLSGAWTNAAGESAETDLSGAHPAGHPNEPAQWLMRPEPMPNAVWTAAAPKPELPAQVPIQQFAGQMEKFLVKQFALTQGNGVAEAKLTLHPEHLGQVDIRIVLQNGQLTAQFLTTSGTAKDMLENQMAQLRTALQGQGLQVDRMEVVQQPTAGDTASFLQQQNHRQGSGGSGNRFYDRQAGGQYDDSSAFEAELERTSFLREIGYGSSINVTA
jgi:flagellar hook-length control protein FliK